MKLNEYQSKVNEFIKDKQGLVIWIADRQQGKSLYTCNEAIETCINNDKSNSCIFSTKLQSKNVIKHLIDYILKEDGIEAEYSQTDRCYIFNNGSRLYLLNDSNPERLRGMVFSFIGIDEAWSIKDLEYITYSVLYPSTISTNGRILLATTVLKTSNKDLNAILVNALLKDKLILTTVVED